MDLEKRFLLKRLNFFEKYENYKNLYYFLRILRIFRFMFKNYTISTTNLNNLYIKYYTNVGFSYFKAVRVWTLTKPNNFPFIFSNCLFIPIELLVVIIISHQLRPDDLTTKLIQQLIIADRLRQSAPGGDTRYLHWLCYQPMRPSVCHVCNVIGRARGCRRDAMRRPICPVRHPPSRTYRPPYDRSSLIFAHGDHKTSDLSHFGFDAATFFS